MRRLLLSLFLLLTLATSAGAANTHGNPNLPELGSWQGDALAPFVHSGCLPTVPSSSLTLGAFACQAYVRGSGGDLVYTDQPAATVTLANTTGVHWVAVHRDTSTAVGGWTRRAGSHYLVQQVSAQPADPSGGLVVSAITVAGGVITTVADIRLPASYARAGVLDVKDPLYGAVGNGTTDDTTALQTALTAANHQSGRVVYVPAGTYLTTSALHIYKNTTLQGAGRHRSVIAPNHNGDGLASTWTINSGGTAVYINLRDLGIYNSLSYATNTGGGFADVAGAYLTLTNVYIQGFKYQVILDQSAHVTIARSEFQGSATTAGIWLVNGPDHTLGANAGYTNLITITENQFNSTATASHILDDGGANHVFTSNNFNGGVDAIRAANTSNLTVADNFFESNAGYAVRLANATLLGGVFVYLNTNPVITRNSFSTNATSAYHLLLDNALGGEVTRNTFIGHAAQTAMMTLGDKVAHVVIEGNTQGYPPSVDKPMLNTTAARLSALAYRQRLQSSVASSAAAGARTIQPRNLGLTGTPERPTLFERLLLVNKDGTNAEIAGITAVSATQIDVTLATDKAADFLVFGLGLTDTLNNPLPPAVVNGTGVIPNGACPCNVTITHGLGYAPFASDIHITQTAANTTSVGSVWVSNIGINTFKVNVDNPPGASTWLFAWRINPQPYRY